MNIITVVISPPPPFVAVNKAGATNPRRQTVQHDDEGDLLRAFRGGRGPAQDTAVPRAAQVVRGQADPRLLGGGGLDPGGGGET